MKKKSSFKNAAHNISIPIIYQDEFLVVANKPGGVAVNGNRNKTVENIIRTSIQRSKQENAFTTPVAAHRLDVPTKGLVLLAKTKPALVGLNKSFQAGEVKKKYIAVVHGQPAAKGEITMPIQGKTALTKYRLMRSVPSRIYQHLSLLDLELLTGRTHQLRIHLKETGHLIVGDKQYADSQKTILGKGLFLCAYQLIFQHPIHNESIQVELPIPPKFHKLLDREEARF